MAGQWSEAQRANFMATLRKQKKTGTGYYAPERVAKMNATRNGKQNGKAAPPANPAKPKPRGKSSKAQRTKWTAERAARFSATRARQKAERLASAAADATAAPALNGNGHGDAHAGGQHFPLDMIPDRMPPMPTSAAQRRARDKASNSGREFPNNAEGARLAVAMELLRTVNSLLRRDD